MKPITIRLLPLVVFLLVGACGDGDAGPADSGALGAADTGHADEAGHDGEAGEHADEEHEDGPVRLTLGEAAVRTAQIQVDTVRPELGGGIGEELLVPGEVAFDPRRVAIISSRTPGRIERVLVVAGDRVGAGQPVAMLQSKEYLTAQQELLQASRRAQALAGTTDEQGARAIVDAARRRLALLGVSGAEIRRVESSGFVRNELAILAPFGGSIIESTILAGQAVEPGQQIFKVADLSIVDVVAAIPERAVPLVHRGQKALISLAAFPQMQFAGTVERVADELNHESRTIAAVIHAVNPSGRLRPGMFATVRLNVTVSSLTRDVGASAERAAPVLTIPASAIVTEGEKQYAFVETAPRTYERRELTVVSLAPPGSSRPTTNRVGVIRGLSAGERVVVTGAFILKSELAKAGLSHDH